MSVMMYCRRSLVHWPELLCPCPGSGAVTPAPPQNWHVPTRLGDMGIELPPGEDVTEDEEENMPCMGGEDDSAGVEGQVLQVLWYWYW